MEKTGEKSFESSNLRRRAGVFPNKPPFDLEELSGENLKNLIEELRIHQVELEMQGEDLRRSQGELQEARDRYRELYDFAPVGYLTLSEKGNIQAANLAATTLLGVGRRTLVGMRFSGFVAKSDQDIFYLHRTKLLETREKQTCELKLVKNDGVAFYAQLECIVATPNGEEPISIFSVFRDISKRKEAEKALLASEERHRMMIENMSSGVAVYETKDNGASFVFKDFNPAAERISHISKEEVIGRELLELFPNMDRFGLVDVLKRVWKTEQNERLQAGYYGDDQRRGWRDNRVYKLPSGEVVAVYDDVTKEKEAEEKLKKSEAKYRDLVENINDIIYAVDMEGVISYISPTVKGLLGYQPKQMVGKNILEFMYQDCWDEARRHLKEMMASGRAQSSACRMVTRKSDVVWVRNSMRPMTQNGAITGAQGILTDITESKKLEAQLREAHKMEAIGRLAGGIAHEFNNVLGIILGNAELALDDVPDWNPARESLGEIRAASLRAKEVVQQILSFAQKTMTGLKPIEMTAILQESLNLMRAAVPATIEIRRELPSKPRMILGREEEIRQILMNLCTNAAYAMKERGGVLEVSLRDEELNMKNDTLGLAPGSYVKLTVKDTGSGIPQEILKKVFDPYFTTKDVGQGTGMGLAVVQGLVKKCHGAIDIRSPMGRGTVVDVFFPNLMTSETKEPEYAKNRGEQP